jgi:hypothetical protein
MKILLVIFMLVGGAPHKGELEMPDLPTCFSEANRFIEYAQKQDGAQQAAAGCKVDLPKEEKS